MSKLNVMLVAAAILCSSVAGVSAAPPEPGAAAEAETAVLLNAIRANRKALVAANLKLTDAEAAKFWPIYDRYQQDLNKTTDRLVAVLDDYTTSFAALPDDKATKLINDYLTVEADRIKVKRDYLEEIAKVLPGRKVARLYQIENKMDAVMRYDLAATIPVVDEQDGQTK